MDRCCGEIVLCIVATLFVTGISGQSTTDRDFKQSMEQERKTGSCLELKRDGFTTSGVYTVYYTEGNVERPVRVYCDMKTDGGGWLVFQRRITGWQDFYQDWEAYRAGFGDLDEEFWLGNYHIHQLTRRGEHSLRVDLADFTGAKRYAKYAQFRIGSASDLFDLHLLGYDNSSTAGDSFNVTVPGIFDRAVDILAHGSPFSTKDRDNDGASEECAQKFKGAWWYQACHGANLNGRYLTGRHSSYADGINWYTWRGYYYSLKATEMKFRPNT